MTREQVDALDQSNVYIEQMFHTIASHESYSYKELLDDLCDERNFEHIKSTITQDVIDEYHDGGYIEELLLNHSLYGYIAQIGMPELSNFSFDEDGNFKSCRVHYSVIRVEYVFGHTIDELVDKCVEIGQAFKKELSDKAKLEMLEED